MPIDPLPSISRSDANFRTQVDDYFLTRLPAFSTQAESARGQIVAAESTTTSAASTAATAATTATTAAGTATSASASAVAAKNAAEAAAANAISTPVAAPIHAAASKTTPSDADELGITDSAASWGLKKLTFANLKAWIGGLFVGKTGNQTMAGSLTAAGLLTSAGALGYGTGSGGTVTQATSKFTAVTLNKPSGLITMNASPLAAGATATFALNNSFIASTDTVVVSFFGSVASVQDKYSIRIATASGFAVLTLKNETAGELSEAVAFTFQVFKGSIS